MIKEIVEEMINDNFDLVVEVICSYFGEKYTEEIKRRAEKINVLLIRDSGIYSCEDGEIYVGDEPVCVKGKENSVVLPLSVVCGERGNVSFVHVLLHALGDEVFVKDNKDTFNEIVVDYMANEICKLLKEKKINITRSSHPVYDSNSFYSKMFGEIEDFYNKNRDKIIGGRMGEKVVIEGIDDYIDGAQEIVDSIFLGDEDIKKPLIKRGK